MLLAVYWLISQLIRLYTWAIILAVVVNLLVNFGVINLRNQFVYTASDFLNRRTEPFLRAIRRRVPYFGNVDVSPIIAILLLEALQYVLADIFARLVAAGWNV